MFTPLKLALTLTLLPAGVFAALWYSGGLCCDDGVAAAELPGRYVEARSASVFAGACHYNGEYTTQGREQVLAFALGDCSQDGVDLSGVELVVVVAGDRNLEEPDVTRRSVVYLPGQLDAPRAEAARAWLEGQHRALLGEIVAVRRGDVSVSLREGAYAVRALDAVRLEGAALPDRECCTMPSNVWYEPEVQLAGRVVGNSTLLAIDEPALQLDLERHDENNAFVGCLAATPVVAGCCAVEPAP